MTLYDLHSVHSTDRPVLVHFVVAGLLATVESSVRGELPLPRLARELCARTDALAELDPPTRILTRLYWLGRKVARLDSALHIAGRTELGPQERAQLVAALDAARDGLTTLLGPGMLDPTGVARPARGAANRIEVATLVGAATQIEAATVDKPATQMGAATVNRPAASGRPSVAVAVGRAPVGRAAVAV